MKIGIREFSREMIKEGGILDFLRSEDVIGEMTDIYADPIKENDPRYYYKVKKARPWIFGRSKHMEQAKKPIRSAIAIGVDPRKSLIAATSIAKEMGGKVHFDSKAHVKDWIQKRLVEKDPQFVRKDTNKRITDKGILAAVYAAMMNRK